MTGMTKRGRRCSICKHPDRARIELLRAGGASLDSLATKFSVDRTSLHRHWHKHVTPDAKAGYLAGPDQLDALRDKAAAESDSVLDYLRITRTALLSSLMACSEAGDARGVSMVAGTLVGCLERIGKITGQISQITSQTNINLAILNSPEWASITGDLLRALAPFPAARTAVAGVLRSREAGTGQIISLPPAAPRPLSPIIEGTLVDA